MTTTSHRRTPDTAARHSRRDEYQEFIPLFTEMAESRPPAGTLSELRNRLITEHRPLAEHIARRYRNRGQPYDDLLQVAMIGLINAVDRFDPARGNDFLVFAIPTITGEIRRYFREHTWSMRVPRRLKELHAAITATTATLSQELGRSPRPSELATALEIPIEEIYEGLQVTYGYRTESLDQPCPDDTDDAHLGVLDADLVAVEHREALRYALSRLPPREVAIISMRFFGDMTQTQIGERVGLSQMQISRLLSTSLATLREALENDADEAEPNRSATKE